MFIRRGQAWTPYRLSAFPQCLGKVVVRDLLGLGVLSRAHSRMPSNASRVQSGDAAPVMEPIEGAMRSASMGQDDMSIEFVAPGTLAMGGGGQRGCGFARRFKPRATKSRSVGKQSRLRLTLPATGLR